MCLAVPGKIVEVFEENGLRMGKIDYGGTIQSACLDTVPEAQIGNYVLVHAGFALSMLDEAEARRTLDLWDELARAQADDSDAQDGSSRKDS